MVVQFKEQTCIEYFMNMEKSYCFLPLSVGRGRGGGLGLVDLPLFSFATLRASWQIWS